MEYQHQPWYFILSFKLHMAVLTYKGRTYRVENICRDK